MTKATPKFKSQPITKSRRWSILHRSQDVKFGPERKKLAAREASLAWELYQHFYPPEKQAALQLLAEVHDVHDYSSIYLGSLNGWSCRPLNLPEGTQVQMLTNRFTQEMFDRCPPDRRLAGRMNRLYARRQELQKKEREFSRTLDKLLETTKTTKQLVELLPEAERWLIEGCSDLPSADLAAQLHSM